MKFASECDIIFHRKIKVIGVMKKKFNEIRVLHYYCKYLAKYKGNGKWDVNSGDISSVKFEFVYKSHKQSVIDWFRDRQWITRSSIDDKKDVCFPITMNQFLECLGQTEITDNNIVLFDNLKVTNDKKDIPCGKGRSISYEELVQIAKSKFEQELEDRMDDIYQKNYVVEQEENLTQ